MSYAPSIELMANVSASKRAALSHRAMVAYANAEFVQELATQCMRYGVGLSMCHDNASLAESLVKGKFNVLFLECDVLIGEYSGLISELQSHRALGNLFIVVYCQEEISQERARSFMGANALVSGDFSDDKLAKLVKRAFSLPKQIWLLTSRSQKELVLALQQIGYDVVVTDSVQVSADMKQHLTPDLIVCDHKMESSSAIEVQQQLADIDCFKSAPFMVTFNGRDVHEIEKLIKSEVGDILLYRSRANTGVLLTVPIPVEAELDAAQLDSVLAQALIDCDAAGIRVAAVTPFVLGRIGQATEGRSVPANLALAENNARVAAEVAVAIARR